MTNERNGTQQSTKQHDSHNLKMKSDLSIVKNYATYRTLIEIQCHLRANFQYRNSSQFMTQLDLQLLDYSAIKQL